MGKVIQLYGMLLRSAFALSGRFEIEHEASKLRACLFISAAQVLNISTVFFIYEAITNQELPHAGIVLSALSAFVLIFNLFFFDRLSPLLHDKTDCKASWKEVRLMVAYFLISLVVFMIAALLLYNV